MSYQIPSLLMGLQNWPFRKKSIFALVLSTMMIPGFVTMIPQYVFVFQNRLGRHLSAADRSSVFRQTPLTFS